MSNNDEKEARNEFDHTAEPHVSTTEAAKLLNCHRNTLLRMAASGRVPAIRIGRDFRFQLSKLMAALAV